MVEPSSSSGASSISTQKTLDYEYAREGIKLWLNNTPDAADVHFKRRLDNLQVKAAYTYMSFMNAVISCELDQMEEVTLLLKELEKQCTHEGAWIRSFRTFFSRQEEEKSFEAYLEEQIILADSYLCSAILIGLSQDISGFVKCGWLLRKAWKVYKDTYNQIHELYKKLPVSNVEPSLASTIHLLNNTASNRNATTSVWGVQDPVAGESSSSNSEITMKKSKSTIAESKIDSVPTNTIPRSRTTTFAEKRSNSPHGNSSKHIEAADVQNLMGGICFGYGALQLCISLLPPNLLKLISIFGFEGDKNTGIQCLMQARKSNDIRAPLASYTLLWYFTIITPFFSMDGYDLRDEIQLCTKLINEIDDEYGDSALTLFFNGRVQRLKSRIDDALRLYDKASKVSAQQEIILLCLHEISWCYIIQLNYLKTSVNFKLLSEKTQFSKSFYAYLSIICEAATGNTVHILEKKKELLGLINRSKSKESQVVKFIARRFAKIPDVIDNNNLEYKKIFEGIYWRLYVYEMLILWNALNSCSSNTLNEIIIDCTGGNIYKNEPMTGISHLVIASCHSCLQNFPEAINSYKNCIETRSTIDTPEDAHISAFAHYELAVLLVKHENVEKSEVKRLLHHVQSNYKNYDFDNRVSVRVHALLKKIDKS